MTIVTASSAAVALAAVACPAASAEKTESGHRAKPRVARRHHTRTHPAPEHKGPYKYVIEVDDELPGRAPYEANLSCDSSGGGATLRVMLEWVEGPGVVGETMLENEKALRKPYTIPLAPATTIMASYMTPAEEAGREEEFQKHDGVDSNPNYQGHEEIGPIGRVCAATSPGAGLGELGPKSEVKWTLSSPAPSLNALLKDPPTRVNPNWDSLAFTILPDGTVPAFAPYHVET